jgi:GT2 family glycosyltransferase
MYQKNIRDLVSIGIATKNRWTDLKQTLSTLSNSSLKGLSIYIVDDNSDTPCPFDIKQFCPNTDLRRFSESQGYIVRRNQLAQLINTKYYLSLDDDSFPVQGSFSNALEFAESQQNLLCISFQVFNPTTALFENCSLARNPYQVRSFIGCGHLLHRQNFLDLGQYREELIHQGEEMEIAARGFLQELYCFHFPGFEIHHTASNQGRNWHRMDYYGARNNLLWNDWFVPEQLKWLQQSRTIASRLALSLKVKRIGQMQGMLSAFQEMNGLQSYRHPFTAQQYRAWRKLPHS